MSFADSQASISEPHIRRMSDFDVLADGVVVGRIVKAAAAIVGTPWLWTLGYGHHEDRSPTHGYGATREAAMAAFAKSRRGDAPKKRLSKKDATRAVVDRGSG